MIKDYYESKHPHTCPECTFYRHINQSWFEQRAKDIGAAWKEPLSIG